MEVVPNKSVQAMESTGWSAHEFGRDDPAATWTALIAHARSWLEIVGKDWIKDQFSNSAPDDIEDFLDEMANVHRDTVLKWVRDNFIDYNNPRDDEELGWR